MPFEPELLDIGRNSPRRNVNKRIPVFASNKSLDLIV